MKAFALSGRFIDDLATINNPCLWHLMYEDQSFHHPLIRVIYPRMPELKVTMEGPSINYMDVTIGPVPGRPKRLATTLLSKRTALHMKGYDVPRMVALVKRQCRRHSELYGTLPRHLLIAIEGVVQARLHRHRLI
ncbi:hypothetical protein WJX82_008693 [Trebouxia sp. C0006]